MRFALLKAPIVAGLAFGVITGVVPAGDQVDTACAHPEHVVGGICADPSGTPDARDQHAGVDGHLPPTRHNVNLVGKVDLTEVDGGVADVGYFEGFAYLNAFSPECAGRSPESQGTGVHVVDVRDPSNPTKVGFLPAEPNSYVGEGISVITFAGKDILVHNNETCDAGKQVVSGVSVWDVTNPQAPAPLGQFGDTTPAVSLQTYHTTHSVQAFVWQGRAYFVAQDNQDLKDVDIFDMTGLIQGTATAPVLAWEGGLEDWVPAHAPLANGASVFHHDMQQKIIDGHNYLLASYWDAGQVLLNIDDPANPVFAGDSDFHSPDPETGFQISEGNSHQSYWSSNNKYVLSSDEDFSPTRTLCEIATGTNAGPTGCVEYGWTVPISTNYPDGLQGQTVFGGSGCVEDLNGNGVSDREEVPDATDPNQIVVFSRGTCFFSIKVETGQLAGYRAVAIGNSHGGSRAGLVGDAFTAGGKGHEFTVTSSAFGIGHSAMHVLFNDEPAFSPPEGYAAGGDLPAIGTTGEDISAEGGVFDAWGYVNLHDATQPNLPIIDTYAVAESLEADHASGFGNLTVHEVKTDPRRGINLAYFSYYDAGLRVVEFGPSGMREVGRFIDEGGNDFWGVFPVGDEVAGHGYGSVNGIGNDERPLILLSDRDFGLYIVDYTGKKPRKD
jgi:hypothetical protein